MTTPEKALSIAFNLALGLLPLTILLAAYGSPLALYTGLTLIVAGVVLWFKA
jgi:hypothetical protein